MKLFNRFFYKLIILFVLLNAFLILESKASSYTQIIKREMYRNINFVNVIEVIKGDLFNDYFEGEQEVSSSIYIKNCIDGKRLMLDTNEVLCIESGQVIRIEKDLDETYKLYIQTREDIYVYVGLNEISVNIYQIVRKADLLGQTDKFDDCFYCYIDILNDNLVYEE